MSEAHGWDAAFEPLAAAFRGDAVETVRRGLIAIANADGGLVGSVGEPSQKVLLRSASKPFQALALVKSGVADRIELTEEELAVACSSHSGEPQQLKIVSKLLSRLGLSERNLACGAAYPMGDGPRMELLREKRKPTPLHHPCSGKHAGMLALALGLGMPIEGYQLAEHPLQRYIAETVQNELAEVAPGQEGPNGTILQGYDGCGVPVYLMGAGAAAALFARLAAGHTREMRHVRDAMTARPELVGGEGRLDTELMRALPGRILAKMGAGGVQALALSPGGKEARAFGCLIKVEDGGEDIMPLVAVTVLQALGVDAPELRLIAERVARVRNDSGREVGRIEVLFDPRRLGRHAHGVSASPAAFPVKLLRARGREREVLRFLQEEWPRADEDILGRAYDWHTDSFVLYARAGREVTGVLKGGFIGGIASLDELLVARACRGRGVGSTLLNAFEEEAKERGCRKIVLRTVVGSRAEDFYRARGYVRQYLLPVHYFGHDFCGMKKDIP